MAEQRRDNDLPTFSLDHLGPGDFERFCCDLLCELGFKNVDWQKGTGLEASPSDRGRDIQCQVGQVDPDGSEHMRTWFVECKHHVKGVPPSHIQAALSWATAEQPDTLLIIASNFLSNPTKDYLRDYERENKPRFKIKVWERPDLERLTLGKSRLLRKYNIVGSFPFLSILHPIHLFYISEFTLNSITYFFETLDQVESARRDEILGGVYELIIRPRYREAISDDEKVLDLRIDPVSYEIFKKKCLSIVARGVIADFLLVFLIVNFTLHCLVKVGDTTSIDTFVGRMKHMREYFTNELEKRPQDKMSLERLRDFCEERIANADENTEQNYRLYKFFCESVVSRLLLEPTGIL